MHDTQRADPITFAVQLGAVLCYAQTMRRAALWLPDHGLLILNASRSRSELVEAVSSLLPSIRSSAQRP